MRYLLNTHRDDAGTRVCIYDLYTALQALGKKATLNDWSSYQNHDVVVFMGYDHEMQRAKRENPKIKIVLADPKFSHPNYIEAAKKADLLLVSSVEQRDSFLKINQNIMIYYMFPKLDQQVRTHTKNVGLIVMYHGNRVHLDAMRHAVTPALTALAITQPVEFRCIYNIANLGRADLTDLERSGVTVTHQQWEAESLVKTLSLGDVGIMPNELPVRNRVRALAETAYPVGNYAYEPFDHLIRFKVSANPGRLYPFACSGLPVVADFCPSAAQFIRDGESGFLASSPHAWHFALSQLALNPALRQTCAARLLEVLRGQYQRQASDFVKVCQGLAAREVPKIQEATPVEIEQREYNEYPRPQETITRWLRRQLRRLQSRLE